MFLKFIITNVLLTFLIAAVAAQPVISRRTADTISLSFTAPNGTTGVFIGLKKAEADNFASDVILCDATTCTEFVCTSVTECTEATTYSWITSVFVSSVFSGTRDLNEGPDVRAALPSLYVGYYTVNSANPVLDVAFVHANMTNLTVTTLTAYTNVFPKSGLLKFSRPSMTDVEVTVVPGTAEAVFMGWKANDLAPTPADGIICVLTAVGDPVSTCIQFSCRTVSDCRSSATVLTKNTVDDKSAVVARGLTAGTLVSIGATMYVSYVSVPFSTVSSVSSTANDRAWSQYSIATPAYNAAPPFTINVTRSSDSTISLSITPPANQTLYFGWRSAEAVIWPADAVICAPGHVSTCLDVICTTDHTCTTRTTTLYTTNSVSATTVSLERSLTKGAVQLKTDAKMYLAYDTEITPAQTTLIPTQAQSRQWTNYSVQMPSQKGNEVNNTFALVPLILTNLCVFITLL